MKDFFSTKVKVVENMDFKEIRFFNTDFRECRIMNSNFSNCLFEQLNLVGAKFYPDSYFKACDFIKVDFSKSTMINHKSVFSKCKFKDCQIKSLDFDFTRFENCMFKNCTFEKINFSASNFQNCRISGILKDVTFNGIYNSNQSNFKTLVEVDFSDAQFGDYVTFQDCDLSTVYPPRGTNFDEILYRINSKDKTILSTGDSDKTVINYSTEDFKKMFK